MILAPAVAAGVTAALLRGAGRRSGSPRDPLTRTNFAGQPVTLAEGPAWVAGAALGSLCAGDRAAALVTVVPGAVGLADDLVGDAGVKGLSGHLGALRRGRVTSGAAKIAGIALAGLAAAVVEHRCRGGDTRIRALAQVGTDAALVAGAANLVNLFDLRPGRALKVVTAANLPLVLCGPASARPALLAALGATVAAAPDDLAGRSMLGDCGANAAGALTGQAVVRALPRRGRALALVGVVALTLASERVSFSQVIDATPALRAVDRWGRPTPAGP